MTKRKTKQLRDEDIDTSDIPETDFSKGVRGAAYRDPYDPALPDKPIERLVGGQVYYTPARQRGPDYRHHLGRLRDALEQIADLADAAQPLSVRAGELARAALDAVDALPVPDDPAYADERER